MSTFQVSGSTPTLNASIKSTPVKARATHRIAPEEVSKVLCHREIEGVSHLQSLFRASSNDFIGRAIPGAMDDQ